MPDTTCDSLPNGVPLERMAFINKLIDQGGPEPWEYAETTEWINAISGDIASGAAKTEEVAALIRQLTEQHFRGTAQAHCLLTPHGYHGDYEIIDIIYRQQVAPQSHLEKWDYYFHAQSAPKAVRNRKTFFHTLLDEVVALHHPNPVQLLNVASGPGRDMREWLDNNPNATVFFDCVELDPKAIEYARQLCTPFLDKIQFHQANALRFTTKTKYRTIWSAGLFDYLEDRLFVRLLRRLLQFTESGGVVVVGNFGDHNPTRNYMELFGGWKLIHRSRKQLHSLAVEAGAVPENISIIAEPEGVNLFLHICKKDAPSSAV
jgi:extracellular factor (EF) 3-hydroxypalmitic acid methyl ester biosynthesis protein